MKKNIEDSFTEERLDSFLKDNYGYGIWEFASSLQLIYDLFDEKKRQVVHQHIEDKVKRLEKIKMNILVQLDDFLTETGFYKMSKEFRRPEKIEWTKPKKQSYIEKHYKLSQFHSEIDGQIKRYKDYQSTFKPTLEKKMKEFPYALILPRRLKPLELLVVTWGRAMKKENQRDWENMKLLLEWFLKKFKTIGIMDLFRLKKFKTFLPDLFRQYWNRYKESDYSFLALIIFDLTFRQKKEKVPRPINVLEELSRRLKGDAEDLKKMIDNAVLRELIIPA